MYNSVFSASSELTSANWIIRKRIIPKYTFLILFLPQFGHRGAF